VIQVAGDVVHTAGGDWLRGIGMIIAGALLLYLLRPIVGNAFA
jgi:hypothetical protein